MKNAVETRNDLAPAIRKRVAPILNQVLANLADLYSQSKQAHWNVQGPYFFTLHKLFDEVASSVEDHVDTVAERVVQLGHPANGTIRQAAGRSALPEFPAEQTGDLAFVAALADRFALCAAATRKAIDDTSALGDADTADLLTAVSRDLDKSLWFLEAHFRK